MAPDERYSAEIDPQLCLGTSACELAAPEHFELNERGVAEFHESRPPLTKGRLLEIARGCPQGAIRIVDARGAPVDED